PPMRPPAWCSTRSRRASRSGWPCCITCLPERRTPDERKELPRRYVERQRGVPECGTAGRGEGRNLMTAIVVRAATLRTGERADLLLDAGMLQAVGSVDVPAGAEVVDADGLVALPGLVDLHTH